MKTRFYHPHVLFLLLAIAALAGGCKKYMDVKPVSQYDLQQAFSDVSNATTALIGVYDELMGDNGYGIRLNLYYPYDSDDFMTTGTLDNGRRGIGRYQLLFSNSEIRNPFLQLYRGVEKANLCIEQIPLMPQYTSGTDIEKRDLRRLHAEALSLRAQFYYELIRNWGDVPAPMIPAYQQKELFVPRSNRDSTYDKILDDLKTAIEMLPWRTETVRNERITKGAAKALRAKIALFRGGYSLRNETKTMERRPDYLKYYTIARDECAGIMERRDQHDLNPDFTNIWKTLSAFAYDPKGEIIFEAGAGGGNSNSDSRMANYDGVRTDGASRYGPGGGGISALPVYFYAFDSIDTRIESTFGMYLVPANNIKRPQPLTSVTNGKYRRDWRNPLLPGQALNVGYNWSFIRFSDVLLMYAEAVNEINGAPTAEAISAFEEVRKRAYKGNTDKIGTTPTDKEGFFKAIVHERRLEFGGEGIRKYDLIRWNLLNAKMNPVTGEIRQELRDLRDGVGKYADVPVNLYYKNNGEEYGIYGSLYKPNEATAPSGYSWVNWRQDLIRTDNMLDVSVAKVHYIDGIAYFFTPNKSELFPFDQATIDSYQGKLLQNPGY